MSGTAAYFIRFAGCNLNCHWCDTEHTAQYSASVQDIIHQLNELQDSLSLEAAHQSLIVLTGGEPTIHDLEPLCMELQKIGHVIAIETNGTKTKQIFELRDSGIIDWITISPKPDYFYNVCQLQNIKKANEVKLVLDGKIVPMAFKDLLTKHFENGTAFIQPCSENFLTAVNYVKEHPQFRLSIQTQKILNIR
jgi:organic radical activating enzyme